MIQRAAVLMWPLQKPDEAVALIEAAMTPGDEDRNHALRTFRAVGHMMAAEPLRPTERSRRSTTTDWTMSAASLGAPSKKSHSETGDVSRRPVGVRRLGTGCRPNRPAMQFTSQD